MICQVRATSKLRNDEVASIVTDIILWVPNENTVSPVPCFGKQHGDLSCLIPINTLSRLHMFQNYQIPHPFSCQTSTYHLERPPPIMRFLTPISIIFITLTSHTLAQGQQCATGVISCCASIQDSGAPAAIQALNSIGSQVGAGIPVGITCKLPHPHFSYHANLVR